MPQGAALGHLEAALQTQLLRAGMSEPPQEASYRGLETVHPIWHDQELEALQHKIMTTLDIQAPKVILTTLPHGECLHSVLQRALCWSWVLCKALVITTTGASVLYLMSWH